MKRYAKGVTLQDYMVEEAIDILASVETCEENVNRKLLALSKANKSNIYRIRKELLILLSDLRKEGDRMDKYLKKYRKLFYEKEAVLLNLRRQKAHLRGFSKNTRRA